MDGELTVKTDLKTCPSFIHCCMLRMVSSCIICSVLGENTEIHVGAALRDIALQKSQLRVTPLTAIFLSKKKDRTLHVREGMSYVEQYLQKTIVCCMIS